MVNLETVLVLGAGASKDFRFPTGYELVMEICQMLGNRQDSQFEFFYKVAGKLSPDMADRFPDALRRANPLPVDAWLEHNPKFIPVGKVAIVMALLCNHEHQQNFRTKNNWYQLLFQRLDSPFEEFQDNKLSIVTFNYDRSLEQYLFETFRYTHTEKSEKECKEKLNQLRILHVYGSLGRLEWQFNDPDYPLPQVRYGAQYDQDTVLSAADSIKIIPQQSPDLPKEFQDARKLIANAQALYFLGFGYHETNMQKLGIANLRIPSKIMGTAYGLDYQRIREIEQLSIRDLRRKQGLFPKSVYEFLYHYINFNELGLPKIFNHYL